jgi:signal transduction histidine kinase
MVLLFMVYIEPITIRPLTKKQLIFSRQDRILDAMLDKDYSGLSDLIHPDASVFGTALHEIEYGFLNVKDYYIKSLDQLPDEMFINPIWKRFTDLGNLALVEQEYEVEFIIDGKKVVLPSMRQSTLWKNENDAPDGDGRWLLLHDHTSLPDQSGDDETLPINHLIQRNLELEKQVAERTTELEVMLGQLRVEAALNHVVAQTASMRTAADLQRIIPLIWKELNELHVPFIRCGVFIFDEEAAQVQMHLSAPNGKALATTEFPYNEIEIIQRVIKSWQKGKICREYWRTDDFKIWAAFLTKHGLIDSIESYFNQHKMPDTLHLHFIPFEQGMLYTGSRSPLSDEQLKTVQALADSFSVAYARYEDFRKLEQNNQNLIRTLEELKAAQDQLVQQEKLASLGQLTAGIAHEIKNPLNFVNNFSEVSLELVEEAREEVRRETDDGGRESEKAQLRQGFDEQAKVKSEKSGDAISVNVETTSLILEILNDIEANLRKIHEHGSRADGIVKSMLMHSRGGDGKIEPTPLNPLIKEYVYLAFHGMRAAKDPINVDIDLLLDETIVEVSLIAEDFSRVILNVCSNAFDAMRDKLTGDGRPGTGYVPKLTVRTHQTVSDITIEIEDNGPGIPDEIRDKILQPFFTTKKGTQGTGLGLSITNDIVKAHGGSLKIGSEIDKGSTFIIELPIV